VPKIRLNADGSPGVANDVTCAGIEHKLGIHGSPTCTLVFGERGECEGYLLGKERHGLLLMFQMMNAARYEVGVQGLAIASAAHEAALEYARMRAQGRDLLDRDPHAPQVPITRHPDVRRNLLLQRAYVQAMRALSSHTAWCMDMAAVSEGADRKRWQGLVELFTPVCKAWCSDWGFRVTEWALQVYGGYGYTAEYPAEQYLRDAKICSIYEGTNGIQALDLVGRKFRMQSGEPVRHLMGLMGQASEGLMDDVILGQSARRLAELLKALGSVMTALPERGDAQLPMLLNAVPVLELVGHAVSGWLLLDQASLARTRFTELLADRGVDEADGKALRAFLEDSGEARFYHNKVQSAIHFTHRALPVAAGHAQAIIAGEKAPMDAIF
jgi:hypothetical protein